MITFDGKGVLRRWLMAIQPHENNRRITKVFPNVDAGNLYKLYREGNKLIEKLTELAREREKFESECAALPSDSSSFTQKLEALAHEQNELHVKVEELAKAIANACGYPTCWREPAKAIRDATKQTQVMI